MPGRLSVDWLSNSLQGCQINYVERPFTCKDCGRAEMWTAPQQKWWYEVAKGGVWTTARRCRPCRQQERERHDEARHVHLEGIARKQNGTEP